MIELIKGVISKLVGNSVVKKIDNSQTTGSDGHVTTSKTEGKAQDANWKHYIAYVLVFLVVYNYVIIPLVMAVFGVWLPPVVLDDVIKMLVLILSGT